MSPLILLLFASLSVPDTVQLSSVVERIVFVSRRDGSSQVYQMNPEGGEVRQLTANPGNTYTPAMSPDGMRVAFVSDHEGSNQIYVIDIDGTSQVRLTDAGTYAEEPSWSPDGERIYYRAGLDDGAVAVFSVEAAGGDPHQVTGNTLRYKEPSVSPDGTRILFNSVGNGGAEIWVMDIDGDNARRLPNTPDWGMAPEWSPDGRKIVYGLLDPATFSAAIHIVNSDGSGDIELFETGEYPCWSPDGSRIAFQTSRDGNFEIYVMNADGTGLLRLTYDEAFDGRPSWGAAGG